MFRPVRVQADAVENEWTITDEVIQLRRWTTDEVYRFPDGEECTIGAAATCGIQLEDPAQLVSRLHARLVREGGRWILRDQGSKNGIRVEYTRCPEICLAPGLEIRIGSLAFIAESARLIRLRDFIARLIGWDAEQALRIEETLRAIRLVSLSRMPLLICGETDVVPIARALHDRVRGADRPFVLYDRRLLPGMNGMDAFAAAHGGTLCVRSQNLPVDFPVVADELRAPSSRVQLIICAARGESWDRFGLMPILIPPMAQRTRELDRIIAGYAADAAEKLMAERHAFTAEDHAWVRDHASSTLPEIEKATERRVALRASHDIAQAAARMNMDAAALARWLEHRGSRELAGADSDE